MSNFLLREIELPPALADDLPEIAFLGTCH
jgi:hypothetical protein